MRLRLGLAVLSPWAYSHVDVLRRYAKFVYNCGQYQQASSLLVSVRALTTDPDKAFSAMWGKLASEVLVQNWEQAVEDIHALRDAIEARTTTPASPLA